MGHATPVNPRDAGKRGGASPFLMGVKVSFHLGKRHIWILSTRNVIWTLGGGRLAPVTFLGENHGKFR